MQSWSQTLGIAYPIIQAPMAGIAARPELVAAVCNAGGMGSLGAAYMTPPQIEEAIGQIRSLTSKAFNVNLFSLTSFPPAPMETEAAKDLIAQFHMKLGLDFPGDPTLPPSFEEQFEVVLEAGVPIFSFTFASLGADKIALLKSKGTYIVGTATTVAEAAFLEEAGVDAVVAQGSEAGAHRGSFLGSFEASLVGTMSLVPQVVDQVRVPVIASGGIMDGRGIRAALALGASAVQLGTAFLVTPEAGICSAYRAAILNAKDDATKPTYAFSGRLARGIRNEFMDAAERTPAVILPYPWQNSLTRPMRNEAAKQNNPEMLSLWAGQSAHLAREMPAADLVALLVKEAGWATAEPASFQQNAAN